MTHVSRLLAAASTADGKDLHLRLRAGAGNQNTHRNTQLEELMDGFNIRQLHNSNLISYNYMYIIWGLNSALE